MRLVERAVLFVHVVLDGHADRVVLLAAGVTEGVLEERVVVLVHNKRLMSVWCPIQRLVM